MKYKIALAGVPNCGKTTLWNLSTGKRGKIGNWSGVTTEKLSAQIKNFPDTELTDVPGIYSLGAHSLEEKAAKDFLLSGGIDSLAIIIDGTKPEQGIYLALELLSLGIPAVVGINFADELEKQGAVADTESLAASLGVPVFLISAKKNQNINELLTCARNLCSRKSRPVSCLSPDERHKKAAELSKKCFPVNYKMMKNPLVPVIRSVFLLTVLILLFGYIEPMLNDAITSFFEYISHSFCAVLSRCHAPKIISSFFSEGLFSGINSLVLFLPELFLIFIVLSFLEESGFMAECAFFADSVLKKFGLSGRSVIPLLLGFGCTVSGVCAAKSSDCLECSKRTLSALMFIPCSARLPLVLLLSRIIFTGSGILPVFLLYTFAVLFGAVFHLLKKHSAEYSFVLEMSKLRPPSFLVLAKASLRRLSSFVTKAGATIMLTSVLIWFLKSFGTDFSAVSLQSESILYRLGHFIAPVFSPLGISFEGALALFCGLFSKESSLSALVSLCPDISASFSVLSGISFLLFYVIYSPCVAAISTIAKEYGAKKAAWLFLRQTALAYFVSLTFYQSAVLITNLFIP